MTIIKRDQQFNRMLAELNGGPPDLQRPTDLNLICFLELQRYGYLSNFFASTTEIAIVAR